jgi:SAM-dependent methyltransferase
VNSTQTWDPERYARNARFVSELGMPVVHLLAPRPGERILDLGCGDGVLAAKLAEIGCKVVGVDASEMQVAAARKLGVEARVISGEALPFRDEFDAVFSNAALHWMLRPEDVIAGVWHALRRGGRFVAEMGGRGCVETIKLALLAALARRGINGESLVPWYFPTIEDYSARLRKAGFVISYIALFPRPTPLPGDVAAWLETFAENFLRALPPSERPVFLQELREELRPKLCDANGHWTADYVRLRFAAQKPE